jgi:hypothetical protein
MNSAIELKNNKKDENSYKQRQQYHILGDRVIRSFMTASNFLLNSSVVWSFHETIYPRFEKSILLTNSFMASSLH